MPTSTSRQAIIKQRIARLLKRLADEGAGDRHAGTFAYTQGAPIDDVGGYGDPHVDDRPDFVKEDDRNFDGQS